MDYKEAGVEFSALVKTVLERSKVIYEVYRIEALPEPGRPLDNDPDGGWLQFRATFAPTPLVIEWGCGSGVPLRAYLERPKDWPSHCFIGFGLQTTGDRKKACQAPINHNLHDLPIRNAIRRGFKPLPEDVLSSAVLDYAYDEGARSFEDWLDQLQIEPPRTGHVAEWLRYWRRKFDQFTATEKPLKALFGPDWDRAVELTQHM